MQQRSLPQLDQLGGFLSVARHGSFTRASQDIGLSQPALSRQIMALEKQLGVQLFARLGRQVRLTPAGEELEARLAPLMEELSRLTVNLAEGSNRVGGRVRLGASEGIALHVLPAILRPLLPNHRRLDLRLTCADAQHLALMVAAGDIDLAVSPSDGESPGLRCTRLWDDELVLVLPMGHASRSRLMSSYLNEPFILPAPETVTRRILDRALYGMGIRLNVVFEHSSTEVLKAMVSAGMGLAIVPEPEVRRETRRGELAAWPLSDLRVQRSVVALADARREPWPSEVLVLNALSHYGRPNSPGLQNSAPR